MEQNFQTSFIPKKPVIKERVVSSAPVGPLSIISIFTLFTVIIATGGLYFYKEVQIKRLEGMKNNLALAQNRFEPELISELQVLDKRLRASNEILTNHLSITPIFEALEKITMKSVRFSKFNYTIPEEPGQPITVKMSGEATGYRAIALQSDLFATNKIFIDPVFSNLTLDNSGNVLFDLGFSVDAANLNFEHTLAENNL